MCVCVLFFFEPYQQFDIVFHCYCYCFYREGDISLIESDAITNTTDETLTEKNTISNRIFERAGPDLYDEILNDNRGMLRIFFLQFEMKLLFEEPNKS